MKFMNLNDNQHGSILLVFIMTLPFLILLAMNYTRLSLTSFQVARFDQLHSEAQLAADAGADYAVEKYAQDASWTGTGGDITLHTDSRIKTAFSATISGNSTQQTIAVIGKTYWPANSASPSRTTKIYVDLRPVTSGNYSLVSGEGGLIMINSSKIVGGDVYVNGTVSLSNTAQIGLSTSPLNVSVADEACPSPATATYPRVCGTGENGEPISIGNTSQIYGTVKATNQTNGARMSSPGLVAGNPSVQALPTYDRAAQKTAATNNMTAAAASCTSQNGSVTWPANTKITGNVVVDHNCVATIKGNVWITGTLTTGNSASILVDPSVGSTRPVVMVDGSLGASFLQSSKIVSNSSGTGVEIITFYSTASCSPDCSTVAGSDLFNSKAVKTIDLNNSAAGSSSIFYAYWSEVDVGNSGAIGAVIGQTVKLTNNGTITFGTASGTPTTTWVVKGYRRQ